MASTHAQAAQALFWAHNPYPGPALAAHNQRILAFALALGEQHHLSVDPDILAAACWLHDMGLLISEQEPRNYLHRGWHFVARAAADWGLTPAQRLTLAHGLLYNHALCRPRGIDPTAELIRLAVQVEHSRGLRRHGLARAGVKDVFARHPRGDLTRILIDFARRTLREDGPRQVPAIFFPKAENP